MWLFCFQYSHPFLTLVETLVIILSHCQSSKSYVEHTVNELIEIQATNTTNTTNT